MSTNLIEECTQREADRQRVHWGEVDDLQMSHYRGYVAAVVADVLDILTAEGRLAPAIKAKATAKPDERPLLVHVPNCPWTTHEGEPCTCGAAERLEQHLNGDANV